MARKIEFEGLFKDGWCSFCGERCKEGDEHGTEIVVIEGRDYWACKDCIVDLRAEAQEAQMEESTNF